MSIQSEIDRIVGAKTTLGNYLQQNGVAVPSGATLDEMALQLADVIEKQNKITVSGILRGDGAGGVSAAVAGTDYATPNDAKAFVVTFTENTGDLKGTYTPDKTLAEIYAAYNANKNIIGRFASGDPSVMMLMTVYDASNMEMGYIYSGGVIKLCSDSNNVWALFDYQFERPAWVNQFLPTSGNSLQENAIYNTTSPVDTYVFTPPESGWAHGTFTTGSSVSVSFSGTFVGAAPTIEASKTYEFDVLDGVWAVQEVVSA